MVRTAGCGTYTESITATPKGDGTLLLNLTHPICPALWNGTAYSEDCASCTGGLCYLNYTLEATEYQLFDCCEMNWTMGTMCGLPNTLSLTGLSPVSLTFEISYCALIIDCMLWSLIQLIPIFYIIGIIVITVLVVVYALPSKTKTI